MKRGKCHACNEREMLNDLKLCERCGDITQKEDVDLCEIEDNPYYDLVVEPQLHLLNNLFSHE